MQNPNGFAAELKPRISCQPWGLHQETYFFTGTICFVRRNAVYVLKQKYFQFLENKREKPFPNFAIFTTSDF